MRYTIVRMKPSDGRLIERCEECGTLVLSRTTHDAWHAMVDIVVDRYYDRDDLARLRRNAENYRRAQGWA